jgi:hypothetical protein
MMRAANAPHGLFPTLGRPLVSPAFAGCHVPVGFRALLGDSAAALALACNARPAM